MNPFALLTCSINGPDPLDLVQIVEIITDVVFSKSKIMKLVYQAICSEVSVDTLDLDP